MCLIWCYFCRQNDSYILFKLRWLCWLYLFVFWMYILHLFKIYFLNLEGCKLTSAHPSLVYIVCRVNPLKPLAALHKLGVLHEKGEHGSSVSAWIYTNRLCSQQLITCELMKFSTNLPTVGVTPCHASCGPFLFWLMGTWITWVYLTSLRISCTSQSTVKHNCMTELWESCRRGRGRWKSAFTVITESVKVRARSSYTIYPTSTHSGMLFGFTY